MGYIYLHMFPVFIFIGLYISIETKLTVEEPESPFQVSNKNLESSEELFHHNDFFDLLNFNRKKTNPQDRKYDQQELGVGNRNESNIYEVNLSHENESRGNLKNETDNNQGNVTGHFFYASNKANEDNDDTNPKRSNEHKSSIIQNESGKRDRKEKKNFKHSNKLRNITLRSKVKNNNYDNLNKHYGNSDDNSKNYLSDEKDSSREYKGSNNLRQILNNFKFTNYKFRNLEKYIDNGKNSISKESDESLNSSSFSKLWGSEEETEENKSECKTDSEENISESETDSEENVSESEAASEENISESEADSEESEEPNSSGQDEGKYSNSKVSHQHNDKSGHLKHRAEHFEIESSDNLNAVYPDKSFEGENMSKNDDEYLIKHENRGESNEDDQLNKNEIPLSVEIEKQTNFRKSNYKYEKNKLLNSNEKHLVKGIYGSNGFVADNQMEKVSSRKRFRRHKKLNFRNLNKQASGNSEDEYLKRKSSPLKNRNKRIKSKFSTPSGEESSTTKRLYYVKVSCENCKIRSKIILHKSTNTNSKDEALNY